MTDRPRTEGMELREKLAADEAPIGSWVSLGSTAAAEVAGGLGFDFVVADTEHTPLSVESAGELVRAVDAAGDTDTVVRVPENDTTEVKRALDLGAAGVMAPNIESAGAAEALVSATRYPPEGVRGVAGSRANDYGTHTKAYFENANESIAVIPQIESAAGVEHADEIAAVDGVDTLFVGPADLSASLGCFGEYDDPTFLDALDRVFAAAEEAGVPVGTLATGPTEIDSWHERGFDYLIVGTDIGYLRQGAKAAKEHYESLSR
ncbi:HpcH/HpaI aldolase family protein [Halolamina salifodinae]|uniref:2-dehydro-3-deoxyglucarate aldolase/4-hydroxy-2-oxoheptanedioate aldolase n=1 Tax=Halolamina salifodinae TaxID=1202767 RepID=A0A8T4GR08_9EURY|nr:aldolase/citrate lyase family protein [Halolamina salifodinae]MBP1985591.1 2-dehydro-3-deoxyglucarate aldolase/4-hydroxy-2-oxoheptanedioate aldolase [Halolamina salifodinae]